MPNCFAFGCSERQEAAKDFTSPPVNQKGKKYGSCSLLCEVNVNFSLRYDNNLHRTNIVIPLLMCTMLSKKF